MVYHVSGVRTPCFSFGSRRKSLVLTLSGEEEKEYTGGVKRDPTIRKFNFQELKTAATSLNASVRKKVFEEYFEMFEEFPSYLYDNESGIDSRLAETIGDLKNDPAISEKMRKGITLLLQRLA